MHKQLKSRSKVNVIFCQLSLLEKFSFLILYLPHFVHLNIKMEMLRLDAQKAQFLHLIMQVSLVICCITLVLHGF